MKTYIGAMLVEAKPEVGLILNDKGQIVEIEGYKVVHCGISYWLARDNFEKMFLEIAEPHTITERDINEWVAKSKLEYQRFEDANGGQDTFVSVEMPNKATMIASAYTMRPIGPVDEGKAKVMAEIKAMVDRLLTFILKWGKNGLK